jgi:hypothetical protein
MRARVLIRNHRFEYATEAHAGIVFDHGDFIGRLTRLDEEQFVGRALRVLPERGGGVGPADAASTLRVPVVACVHNGLIAQGAAARASVTRSAAALLDVTARLGL